MECMEADFSSHRDVGAKVFSDHLITTKSTNMAGSQLKQLKAALQAKGLVGQTNIKRKNKKQAPSETRRDAEQKKQEISRIRDDFNQFDNRINRAKHDYTVIQGGKFVKAGSKQHNQASRTKSGVEKSLKTEYSALQKTKGRVGGMVDRRFGEKDRNMTQEEKMLERFTRERQSGSKRNAFSLESDDEYDEDEGFSLTHSGKAINFDHFEDSDLGVASAPTYVDEDSIQPPRKKTKKEVMAEVIAKSKFHRKQRQLEFQKTQEEIGDLDEDFADVMGEIHAQKTAKPAFVAKSEEDRAYDAKVRELTYDRRAVPADRTKTQEELAEEHREKMQKLEADRLKRMSGYDAGEAEADDLDDFWVGSDEEGEDGVQIEGEGEEDDDEEEEGDDGRAMLEARRSRVTPAVAMPTTHEQFLNMVQGVDNVKSHIEQISKAYHPRLAEGNKDKMDVFVAIVFEHILHLANQKDTPASTVDELTHMLRRMAEQYNQALVETARQMLEHIERRVVARQLQKQDLVFFVVLGYVFSASDHFHLVVTPALLVMNQFLNGCVGSDCTLVQLGQGLFLCDVLLGYQSFSRRYDPEVVKFVEHTLLQLVPEPTKIGATLSCKAKKSTLSLGKTYKPTSSPSPMRVQTLFEPIADEDAFKFQLVERTLAIMDRSVSTWMEKSALVEVVGSFERQLKHLARYYSGHLPTLGALLTRFGNVSRNQTSSRKPLRLQEHRQLAIKTFAPKFEENFNPDKKSYDLNRERQEMNKMKAQVKKEKKLMMKDFRKQTQFIARQQIGEKKQMYSEYHRKMANIVNSISTVEGAEKNEYEREKKRRQNKR